MRKSYPEQVMKLINCFKRLPGVGSRTAERYAFSLLNWPSDTLSEMGETVSNVRERVAYCDICGAMMEPKSSCPHCTDESRDRSIICVVASAKDIFIVEDTRQYRGLYHVVGGVLSPLEGMHPEDLSFANLKERIEDAGIKEVIIALDSTLEGDATALYLKRNLESLGIIVSRLAFGMPMGSSLDFIDGGTLACAIAGRNSF